MRFLRSAQLTGKNRCALTGRATDDEGFFITGRVLTGVDPTVELSAAAVKEAARQLGWYPAEEVAAIEAALARLKDASVEQNERIDKLTQLTQLTEELTAK
jgi:hypothetical protein